MSPINDYRFFISPYNSVNFCICFETVISYFLPYHCFIFMASWTFIIMKWLLLFLDRNFLINSAWSDFNYVIEDFFFVSLYCTRFSDLLLTVCLGFYVYYAQLANGSSILFVCSLTTFSFNLFGLFIFTVITWMFALNILS